MFISLKILNLFDNNFLCFKQYSNSNNEYLIYIAINKIGLWYNNYLRLNLALYTLLNIPFPVTDIQLILQSLLALIHKSIIIFSFIITL